MTSSQPSQFSASERYAQKPNQFNTTGMPATDSPMGMSAGLSAPNYTGMNTIDLGLVLRAALQNWWLILLSFVGVVGLTLLVLQRITPEYRASAILEVRQETRNVIDVEDVESVIADSEFLTTQVELLRSETVAVDVIEALGLVGDPAFAETDSDEWARMDSDARLRTSVEGFREHLSVSPVGRSRLIRVSFEHPNPRRAAEIVNVVTETFISNALARRFNATAYARDFLQERLALIKTSLEAAERDLVQYASDNGIIILEDEEAGQSSGSLDAAAIAALNISLVDAQSELSFAESALEQARSNSFTSDILASNSVTELKKQKVELDAEYIEQLATFKPTHPDMLELKARIDLFDAAIAAESDAVISGRLAEAEATYATALARVQSIQSRLLSLKDSLVDLREKSIEYNIRQREVETERTQYEALLQRLREVSITDDIGANLVEVVDEAQVPMRPARPNKPITILLASLLGTAIGMALATFRELFDNRIGTPADVTKRLESTVMGVLPTLKSGEDIVSALSQPAHPLTEALASLRTNVRFSGTSDSLRVIHITSTRSGEGKSSTTFGLASSFAALGARVLLIDADLRLPTFSSNAPENTGLSNMLVSNDPLENHIIESQIENLWILPCGASVPNPSELLSSAGFAAAIEAARDTFDYVLIDSPPILGLADAPLLGTTADATLLIVQANAVRSNRILAGLQRMQQSHSRILGVVLNRFEPKRFSAYQEHYAYSYSYAEAPGSTRKTAEARKKRRIEVL